MGHQHAGVAAVSLEVVRLNLNQLLVARHRLVVAAECGEQGGTVEAGLGIVRADGDGPVEAHDRGGRAIEGAQRGAAIVVGLGNAVIDGDRAIVDVQRFGVAAEVLEHDAEIAECIHRVWIDRKGRRDQGAGVVVIALLVAQHAQEVQRVEMVRAFGEDLRIDRLRRFQIARLVELNRLGKHRSEVDRFADPAHHVIIIQSLADTNSAGAEDATARFPRKKSNGRREESRFRFRKSCSARVSPKGANLLRRNPPASSLRPVPPQRMPPGQG
jgi:hypothetical protein